MTVSAGRTSESISYLLVNSPLTDPTAPYHSLSYLVGAAAARGFTGYKCLDANVDGLNYLARPENVAALLDRARTVLAEIETAPSVRLGDEVRYQLALSAHGLQPTFVADAIKIFQDAELFYHHPTYRQAVTAMSRWQDLMSLDGLPWAFEHFEAGFGLMNLSSLADLCSVDAIDDFTRPFEPYITGPYATALAERDWDLIGFSVNYTSQLPFALRLAREARAICPDACIVFGGTEVCDDVRFSEGESYWDLFPDADVIVPGEGETPLSDMLAALRDGSPLDGIRGALVRGSADKRQTVNYEHIGSLPPPKYDIWDLNKYWSPEPVILYSPTRGCYWNKCTFCDYGLNSDSPTSPSRNRPVENVIDDLANISKVGRTVYFAVDAMSPRYLRMLCEAMAEADLGVRWSAELRLERTFPKSHMAQLLKRAGCVAISFGYESGSQRILNLIDKGTRIAEVSEILRQLAGNGIGAQMMGFVGFPSETAAEARQTYGFLAENRDLWTLAGIGEFTLTPGSIVAKQPDRFGIEVLPLPPGDDIRRYVPYRDKSLDQDRWPGEIADIDHSDIRLDVPPQLSDRPFVGGIDSAHTLLYFARFGRRLLPEETDPQPRMELVPAVSQQIAFSSLSGFVTRASIREQFVTARHQGGASHQKMLEWLQTPSTAARGRGEAVILPSGVAVAIPDGASPRLREAILLTALGERGATDFELSQAGSR